VIDETEQVIESAEVLRLDLNGSLVRDGVIEDILQLGEVDRLEPLIDGSVESRGPIKRVHKTWLPITRNPIVDLQLT
jgi:hypothetical protein